MLFIMIFNTLQKNNANKTRLYPGVLETVRILKQKGIKMAIVSNKYQQGVLDICIPLLGKYIDVMVGEQDGLDKNQVLIWLTMQYKN